MDFLYGLPQSRLTALLSQYGYRCMGRWSDNVGWRCARWSDQLCREPTAGEGSGLQREEEHVRGQRRQSTDRRFQAYSEFLIRTRSFCNATEAYYVHPHHKSEIAEIDSLLQSANDASALVFLVVESDGTYEACRNVL